MVEEQTKDQKEESNDHRTSKEKEKEEDSTDSSSDDDDDDDDDSLSDDDDDEVDSSASMQLGFSVPIPTDDTNTDYLGHRSPHWYNDWDGGVIGGRPSWLQPRDIPKRDGLLCPHCPSLQRFVCQLYAPIDTDGDDETTTLLNSIDAFHRSLYVFVCPNPVCYTKPEGAVRVLRAQLPKINDFYPPSEEDCGGAWKKHLSETHGVHRCAVSGLHARGKCPIQKEHFCSKEHQKEHKKHVFDPMKKSKNNKTNSGAMVLPSVYRESELVVEEEPPPLPSSKKKNNPKNNNNKTSNDLLTKEPLFPSSTNKKKKKNTGRDDDDDENEEDDDEDAKLTQSDLNHIVRGEEPKKDNKKKKTSEEDPVTRRFYARVREKRKNVAEQCLRYDMDWNKTKESNREKRKAAAELWIRSDYRPPESKNPPDCERCGAPRRFEFQIMPQMLHYLLHDNTNGNNNATTSSSSNKANLQQVKQALLTANTIIDQNNPSNVPPGLVDAKNEAITKIKNQMLYNNDNNNDNDNATNTQKHDVDWGTIAVYTCSTSCSYREDDDDHNNPLLGCYMEEYSWKQPSLDIA